MKPRSEELGEIFGMLIITGLIVWAFSVIGGYFKLPPQVSFAMAVLFIFMRGIGGEL
jgi:hypothetical protein